MAADTYTLDGERVTQAQFEARVPVWEKLELDQTDSLPGIGATESWRRGLRSDSAGVHPKQIDEMEARCRRHGNPVEFDRETGEAVFHARRQRARHLDMRGMHDRDGGYGDG